MLPNAVSTIPPSHRLLVPAGCAPRCIWCAYTDKCGPSDVGGNVFDPSSYNCSATCELTNGVPSTPIGAFHNEIVNDLLPTLHGKNRSEVYTGLVVLPSTYIQVHTHSFIDRHVVPDGHTWGFVCSPGSRGIYWSES